ncbi:TIGR04282 family arsenosugar biosynthesis glycosyltransferase [Acidocella aquatica]|uniref:TIGR04282 family arsenosugar biosynthesis glycosyltransferase n=1 Tax=Acidocella aquatica TaxID=1922313 RepID=UPI0024E11F88|nr:TIGR04282 family arsenosugar biosynthesis glycosyltransferase [Acidocella aquatica]
MNLPVVIVFARIPRLGVGKRRLAREVGDRKALNFSRTALHRLLRRVRRLRGVECVLALSPDHHARLRAPGFTKISQGQGDLGQRMQRAIHRYPRRRVVLIGSDIPGISTRDLRNALHNLRGYNAVFGPAADGGYWLAGMAGTRPERAFSNVRWSSPHALADTLHNFSKQRTKLLRMLDDVDDAASLTLHMHKAYSHA